MGCIVTEKRTREKGGKEKEDKELLVCEWKQNQNRQDRLAQNVGTRNERQKKNSQNKDVGKENERKEKREGKANKLSKRRGCEW